MRKSFALRLLKLSIPIIIGQMGQMLISAGDVYIATMYSTKTVASIGVANGFINPFFLFGIGLMMGVSPVLARRRGKGAKDQMNLVPIIFYALLVGGLISMLLLALVQYTDSFGVEPELIPSLNAYIDVVAWSIPFAIVFQAVKEFLQSFEKVVIPNLISIVAVVLNLGVNYLLVFGFPGFEGVGELGLAYASVAVRIFLCGAVLIYAFRYIDFKSFQLEFIMGIFKFSLPVAFMFFLEVMAFCSVSIMSGKLGTLAAATNNIIITISSIAFMVPLSLSSAVGVKIGHAYGQKDNQLIFEYIRASVGLVFIYMLISSSLFFFAPEGIMQFLTDDQAVIQLGVKLLLIVAIFQSADGIQVLFSGVLRGLADTRTSFFMVLIGYWLIGIPTGYYLTFYQGKGPQGLWIGLALSLFLVAFALSGLTIKRYRKVALSF